MDLFTIPAALYGVIIEHSLEGYPNEVCGLIGGVGNLAFQATPIANVSPQARTHYYMDPEEQCRVMLAYEAHGQELVGIYHSHPAGPSRPSETDIAESYYPDVVYLIVNLADRSQPHITAWTIREGVARQVKWKVSPPKGSAG
jgi:proteasome lid subunit RPN8/RPN11